jgi:hypothetical protein
LGESPEKGLCRINPRFEYFGVSGKGLIDKNDGLAVLERGRKFKKNKKRAAKFAALSDDVRPFEFLRLLLA